MRGSKYLRRLALLVPEGVEQGKWADARPSHSRHCSFGSSAFLSLVPARFKYRLDGRWARSVPRTIESVGENSHPAACYMYCACGAAQKP